MRFPVPADKQAASLISRLASRLSLVEHRVNDPTEVGGVLARDALQSTNYAAGTSGWTVNADGSAEFNNVTIRAGSVTSVLQLIYNPAPGAGNLIQSVSAGGGTDAYGNVYLPGDVEYITVGGTSYALSNDGKVLAFWTAASQAGPWTMQNSMQGSDLVSVAAAAGFKPSAPLATSSLTLVMMGLGATVTYTPVSTGKVHVTCTGVGQTATAVANWTVGGRYGTGTAPVNGAAVTGTRWGGPADKTLRSAATATASDFSLTDLLSLTPASAYWFDLALDTGNAADAATVSSLSFFLEEVL